MDSTKVKKSRKNNPLKEEDGGPELSKDEVRIAKYLRLSCPNKQGSLQGMKVDFFIASRLVDSLMSSQWGPINAAAVAQPNKPTYFTSRQACVNFMQRLMNKQMFYRAVKIYKDQHQNDKESSGVESNTPNLRKRKTTKEAATAAAAEGTTTSQTPTPKQQRQQQQQEKRKFKLDVHEDQKFVDNNEPYVWIYDPTSTKTYIIGALLILGAIGICLFPLWPTQVREGVIICLSRRQLSGCHFGLAVLKYIMFGVVWALTIGKVRFWLLPNLTEDCGFVESFMPIYKIESETPTTTTNTSAAATNDQQQQQQSTSVDSAATSAAAAAAAAVGSNLTTTELSKSTLDINTVKVDTPRRKKSLAGGNGNVEDDYEMVNDDELDKE